MHEPIDNPEVVHGHTPEERNWAMFAHLGGLAGYFIPFGNIIVPLIIYSTKKDESAFIRDQAKESLNFNISITVYIVIGIILVFVLIGIILLPIIALGHLILTIIASIKSSEGKRYIYPLTIQFVS